MDFGFSLNLVGFFGFDCDWVFALVLFVYWLHLVFCVVVCCFGFGFLLCFVVRLLV